MTHPLFTNRVAVLASMHQKERVIAPLLERELGVRLIVANDFDTDRFGTFTRDRDRPGSQRETARLKAEAVLEQTGESLAIASEGTFAPHPGFPAIACNRELVLLLDKTQQLEIWGQEFSIETNYGYQTVQTLEEALVFANKVGFPEHGLIVMPDRAAKTGICKGIVSQEQLTQVVTRVLETSPTGTIHLETDMRALYNPTRMKAIEKATIDLLKNLNCTCPACSAPGFELVERLPGLPCELCQMPTGLARSALYRCQKCDRTQEVLFPDGIRLADPAQCGYCNP